VKANRTLPITLLTGFLGSGKTTLLRRWRRDESLRDAAVIVHDLSEFGLDAELLSDEGTAPGMGALAGRTAALHGPHARGLLNESVRQALAGMAELDPPPPMVLVESTGAARPWPLLRAMTQDDRFTLRHFIVTVDALNLHRDFADGLILLDAAHRCPDPALRHAADVLSEQLAFANIIILTKTDTVTQATVKAQVETLQKIQPYAAIGLSAHAGIHCAQLDTVPAPDLAALRCRAETMGLLDDDSSAATASDIDCLILREQRPFHPQRLFDACQHHLGTGLYRTKGYLWLASRPGHVLLWQQSGSQISLELTGQWRAEIANSQDEKLLPEERELLREQLKQQDPIFGDRHIELTLIGLPAAREAFALALRHALCTDEEVTAWQHGEVFSDPWPQSLQRFQ
jgi:G3E family GTPase